MSDELFFSDPLAHNPASSDLFHSETSASASASADAAEAHQTGANGGMVERLDLTLEKLDLQCPRCNVLLQRGVLYQHWEVCGCATCGGFVVPKRSLQEMIRRLRAAYQGPDDQPTPLNPSDLDVPCRCPGCHRPMETHPYYGPGNSVIDSCSGCQVTWLDQSELEKIIRAPGQRGDGFRPSQVRPAFDVPPDPLTTALNEVLSRRSRSGLRWF